MFADRIHPAEDIIDAWIDVYGSDPKANVDEFLKGYKLSSKEKDELKDILLQVDYVNCFYEVCSSYKYEEAILTSATELFDKLYVRKEGKSLVENVKDYVQTLKPPVQHLFQYSFRKDEKPLSDKDKNLINDFINEIKNGEEK